MTDRKTIRLVITMIGLVTLGALAGTYMLAQRVLDQSAGTGSPDAAAVALVGVLGAVVTGGLGYLGGVLASTRSTPDKAEIEEALAPLALPPGPLVPPAPPPAPVPVVLEQPAGDTVKVEVADGADIGEPPPASLPEPFRRR